MRMEKSLDKGISILIPTFNNLPYLKLCIDSIKKHTVVPCEILLHVSQGSDGTLEWVRENNFKHTYSKENVGVSVAMNRAKSLSSTDLLMYVNDDMYVLPGWDTAIFDYIKESNCYIQTWISGTMIEPIGCNPVSVHANHGKTLKTFQEKELLSDTEMLRKIMPNYKNAICPPTLLHRIVWDMVSGYDENVFAAGSDVHLAKAIYGVGCHFIQVGSSLVYHFCSKTVSRIKDPRKQKELFQEKYGITIDDFYSKELVRKLA